MGESLALTSERCFVSIFFLPTSWITAEHLLHRNITNFMADQVIFVFFKLYYYVHTARTQCKALSDFPPEIKNILIDSWYTQPRKGTNT